MGCKKGIKTGIIAAALNNTELQSAKLIEYEKRIASLNKQKRQLYEDWLMQANNKTAYLERKAVLDKELNWLTRIKNFLAANINQARAGLRFFSLSLT